MMKKNKKILKIISILGLLIIPTYSAAVNFAEATNNIIAYSQKTINFFIALALIFFFWGVIMMVTSPDNSKARESAKTRLVWGVIVIFIAFSVWGILQFMKNTTKLNNTRIDVDLNELSNGLTF